MLDSTHGLDIIQSLERMGVKRENILVWSKNGIEYYYPSSIIDSIYGSGGDIQISGDNVERNGISYKKAELTERVISCMREGVVYPEEFREKFLASIETITGLTSRSSEHAN